MQIKVKLGEWPTCDCYFSKPTPSPITHTRIKVGGKCDSNLDLSNNPYPIYTLDQFCDMGLYCDPSTNKCTKTTCPCNQDNLCCYDSWFCYTLLSYENDTGCFNKCCTYDNNTELKCLSCLTNIDLKKCPMNDDPCSVCLPHDYSSCEFLQGKQVPGTYPRPMSPDKHNCDAVVASKIYCVVRGIITSL